MYDSYVRAFRWASDRIGSEGVVCFVSNAGWLRSEAGAGIRRSFTEEYNSVYIYDFRGNQRTQGETSRKEGGKVFGSGSRAAVAITLLVRNPKSTERGIVHYFEVGNYKTREQKLESARKLVGTDPDWILLTQDAYGDWLDQRDDSFYDYAPIGLEKYKEPNGVFTTWSSGVKTQRDPWAWGYSRASVSHNIERLVNNTNREIQRLSGRVDDRSNDSTRFSWTRAMRGYAARMEEIPFDEAFLLPGAYRPFCKQWVYFEKHLNEVQGQQDKLFPIIRAGTSALNVVITYTGGVNSSALVSDTMPDLHLVGDSQCFPLYWYEKDEGSTLFKAEGEKVIRDAWGNRYVRHDAITNHALAVFREAYPTAFLSRKLKDGPKELTKEDVFYYVYGILHSPEYRERFATNLQKELPRIPLAEDFEAFSRAGRALADLHLNYESVEPWAQLECTVLPGMDPGPVAKLAWGKRRDPETRRLVPDRTRMVYSKDVVVSNIPPQANDYKVNGRSPLEWMVDRYKVTTDKKTGIVNDPNLYSDDPRYILDLIGRLVTVSMRTLEIVAGLPALREKGHTSNWPKAWSSR